MKYYYFIQLLLFFSLSLISPLLSTGQIAISSESISQSNFQKLDLEQQRILVHKWMNGSQQIEIPTTFKLSAIEFFSQQTNGEAIYQKYTSVFRPLFNTNLSLVDRINFCSFLLKTFGEDEIPMHLIRTQKEQLINLFTK